jgi:hypothetical protein
VAVAGDAAVVVDLDPGAQDVGEPEAVGGLERGQVLELLRGRRVVVGDAKPERQLGSGAFHRPERDPRQGGDRRLDTQGELLLVSGRILPGPLRRR